MFLVARKIMLCIICVLLSSCAYRFQGDKNPLKELGVEKIYIASFQNSTFRPGLEQLFSTAMVREFQKYRHFTLVGTQKEADAILDGSIVAVDAASNATKSFDLSAAKKVNVASEYNASVSCEIVLRDRFGKVIFSQVVGSNKIYSSALGDSPSDSGATIPLVNESEQRIAIQFLASQMMASVYQRMIDTF